MKTDGDPARRPSADPPTLAYVVVADWPQLPPGLNFGVVSSVAVDREDHVWVFHRGPHPVMEFDNSGRFLQAWQDVPVVLPHGIRVDAGGMVWLVDVDGSTVMKCNREGRIRLLITHLDGPGDNESRYAFNRPASIAFRSNGNFCVADGYGNSRVVEYDGAGTYVRQWGRKGDGDGEFDLVHDIVIDEGGTAYVADRGNRRVQVFDAAGQFLATWTELGTPWGLAYAKDEEAVFICDGDLNRVVKANLNGEVVGAFGAFGKGAGSLDMPHHMAIDSEGSLYVAELSNWRVQKFARGPGPR